jgi:two-component system chemotaxis response regulator CheY
VLQGTRADLVMILSDINMPGMSGLELLRSLRKRGVRLPIYMISAYENESYQQQSEELGADGFIPKPLDFESIRSLIMQKGNHRKDQ